MRQRVFGHEENAARVDGKELVPKCRVHLGHRLPRHKSSGDIHEDLERSAEALLRSIHKRLDAFLFCDVAGKCGPLAAGFLYERQCLLSQFFAFEVAKRHRGAKGGQLDGDCSTDIACASRNKSDFAVECSHTVHVERMMM